MLRRFISFFFSWLVLASALVSYGGGYLLLWISKDLPDYQQLSIYEPPVMTRIHAADGSLLGEYATERRLYLPISSVPESLIQAFLSSEDKKFYQHPGIDYESILAAFIFNVQNLKSGRRPIGASTITQQVAKNFLLTNELSYKRKLREILLALKIEQAFSKDKILELYLNEIYLGLGSYGVAASALKYFGKGVFELDFHEMAYLAALPKAPNNYHPFRHPMQAKMRRNWVLDRMYSNGFISLEESERAKGLPLGVKLHSVDPSTFAAGYFTEEVRRIIYAMYGERKLYEGGLSVRTTLDPKMQIIARNVLIKGLISIDRSKGWRGPVDRIRVDDEWGRTLLQVRMLNDINPWRMGIVLEVNRNFAEIGLRPSASSQFQYGNKKKEGSVKIRLDHKGIAWTRKKKDKKKANINNVLSVGDVIYVAPEGKGGEWELMQIPEIEGALVAIDPHTGRVKAMVGGFSYDGSQFNRATQAMRQPGSAFKPFVYAAALDNGYTPSSIVMDAPVEIDQGPGLEIWRPRNYSRTFFGPSTLRRGVEKSRNVMTVRLAKDIGMPLVSEYAKRFGIYDNLLPFLAMSLGAGETTVLRLTAAYAMLDNGGKKVTPTLIDRIQDRWGNTIYRHDERECQGCAAESWTGQNEPVIIDHRPRIISPYTSYQVTSILEGVIRRGTGSIVRAIKRPIAGKTGTTNGERDAWFVGYSPELAVGVFVGYDKPRSMGRGATGGRIAAPIFRDFMSLFLADKPAVPFPVPSGIQLFRVNVETGLKARINDRNAIMEAFKPGEAPPDQHSMIGYTDPEGWNNNAPGSINGEPRSISSGSGGLY
ncbi:MAG: penicillin-binding protein 1A [Alphaproteobacteria bacterium]|nr:penicillin-binding protein 1A [Alphaproteobacteria bacterium]